VPLATLGGGWELYEDEWGRGYYHHSGTGETQWDAPAAAGAGEEAGAEAGVEAGVEAGAGEGASGGGNGPTPIAVHRASVSLGVGSAVAAAAAAGAVRRASLT
jgi:hypothetical protein